MTPWLAQMVPVDGIPIPWLVAMALGGVLPGPYRAPRYGLVQACGPVDYPGVGTRVTVLYEGGAVVFNPTAPPEERVTKVHWRDVPRVAKVLGVQP